jgi:hypothetical protein
VLTMYLTTTLKLFLAAQDQTSDPYSYIEALSKHKT